MKQILFLLLSLLFFSKNNLAQSVDHWETIIFTEDIWKYRIGDSEPPADWYTSTFDDSVWSEGSGGIGYADGDDETIIPATTSVYLRMDFEIVDISHLEMALLHADYDDGFIAYLNGVEIARANMEEILPPFDASSITYREAQIYQGGLPIPFSIDKNKINQCLQNGNNTLAIQIHNFGIGSSDLSAIFFFSVGVNESVTNYFPTPDWFVVPFESSDLPILKINTAGASIPNEPKIVAQMGIIDNGPGNRNYIFTDPFNGYNGQIVIEIRGASSQGFPKKNYGFETQNNLGENNNVSLLGMPEENDWILHGPFSDKSLIRNVLAYHLGNQMGRWTPRTRFCELFINDDYRGIYILTEKIKRDKNRVDIAKLTPDDNEGDELTGGYILQVDREEVGNGWWSSFSTNSFIVYQHPNTNHLTVEQEAYIFDYMNSFEANMTSDIFMDSLEGYTKYIEVSSFVDHLLAAELTLDVDAYRLSSFLYKDKESKGGKLNAGPLWDYNLAFGNADYGNAWLTSGWRYSTGNSAQPFWWNRLLEDEKFRNQLQCRWQELRAGVFQTDSILQFIDEQAATLAEAQVRNFERWTVLGEYVWPNYFIGNTYEEEIDYLKNWTTERLIWMDANLVGVCEVVATEELKNNISLTVRPNPFLESVDFVFGKNNLRNDFQLGIYDVLGNEIRVFDVGGNEVVRWDGKNSVGNNVGAGVYFYVISSEKGWVKSGRILRITEN